ncbi:MAG TPA: hypothetical protein VEK15_30200 [Vicinamibacteria bacterium]|nr:hypothetical protein [Vicinamibacteria bacterium]
MKAGLPLIVLVGCARLASGDWLVLADGSRTEVRRVEVLERSVRVTTLSGQTWIVLKTAVDVGATSRANEIPPAEVEPVMEPVRPPSPRPEPPLPPTTPAPTPLRRTSPPSDWQPPAPPASSATAPREPEHPHRVAVFVNAATGRPRGSFSESRSFELFSETASVDTLYENGPTRGAEVGAVVRLSGPIAVSASFDFFENEASARYRALLPHPFFYEQFRELSETRSGLVHREQAFHIGPVVSMNLGRRLSLDLYGGASKFFVEADVLDDVLYAEAFPFESVVSQGSILRRLDAHPWGYHVGASSTVRLVGFLGVDVTLRYSRADFVLLDSASQEIRYEAGGLRVGTGLRFLFP